MVGGRVQGPQVLWLNLLAGNGVLAMLFKPKWVAMLPEYMVPPDRVITSLERLRKSIGCPHDAFAMRILGSDYATGRAIRTSYVLLKSEIPGCAESDILCELCRTRLELSDEPGLLAKSPEAIVSEHSTLQKVIDFFVREESEAALPDPYGWGEKVDALLDESTWPQ